MSSAKFMNSSNVWKQCLFRVGESSYGKAATIFMSFGIKIERALVKISGRGGHMNSVKFAFIIILLKVIINIFKFIIIFSHKKCYYIKFEKKSA